MGANLELIVESFANKLYDITTHGSTEMDNDKITTQLLEEAIGSDKPKIMEDYPLNNRGPSCLILGWTTEYKRPIHVCIGYAGSKPEVITAYRPDLSPRKWTQGFCKRRRVK